MEDAGVPVFVDPTAAIRTLGAISRPRPLVRREAAPALDAQLDASLRHGQSFSGAQALGVLKRAGLPVAPSAACATAEGAAGVAPMVSDGVECILGVHTDPVFGPVVRVGLGGVLVEVLHDVSFRLAPFDHATAREMIDSLKGKAVLYGARGRPKCDVEALAEALVRLSHFADAAKAHVQSIDINPFLVLPEGRGGLGIDAVVETWRESRTQRG